MSAPPIGDTERELQPDPVGSAMFARYAFPPNRFDYCGPTDTHSMLAYAAAVQPPLGNTEDVAGRARQLDGAWPYLEMIAAAAGFDDPLDARVVEAYWLGNELLAKIDPPAFVSELGRYFSRQLGGSWRRLAGMSDPVVGPHHMFHVFEVYPWVGLLGRHANAVALTVLDRCRIRWGQVVSVDPERAVVRSSPLRWDGRMLDLTSEVEEQVRRSGGGGTLGPDLEVGDWVSLHWDWVCDVLSDEQLAFLEFFTTQQLDETNLVLDARAVAIG
jgi:Family of unknown function (DUF6390)